MSSKFQTNFLKGVIQDNGVIFCDWHLKAYKTLTDAKKHIELFEKALEHTDMLILSDIRGVRSVSKDVRDYLASDEIRHPKAHAILVGSAITKMIGNLFLRFNKPKFPNKIFKDIPSAEAWLLSFKQ